jgi:hypothetical protein
MKAHLLWIILLTGCHTASQQTVETHVPVLEVPITGNALNLHDTENIRYSEELKGYPVGRHEDAQGNLHEGHVIYRVENRGRWNLLPNMPTAVPMGPAVAVADPARQTALLSGELDQKIREQNLLLQATTEQNDRLSVEINKLQEELSKAREVAQKFEELNQKLSARDEELQQARSRLDELEKQSKAFEAKPSETTRSWWKFWN